MKHAEKLDEAIAFGVHACDNIHACPEETGNNLAVAPMVRPFTMPAASRSGIRLQSAVLVTFPAANVVTIG